MLNILKLELVQISCKEGKMKHEIREHEEMMKTVVDRWSWLGSLDLNMTLGRQCK